MAEMTIRAATAADIDLVYRELQDVILSSPHYGERFKRHEAGRLDKTFCAGFWPWTPGTSC
ncbi:hypothetical protein [Devosia aurantiaca]|uniref:N-acetyltransferase domain-containing protein n=1 Tax=Devosia aurantiaca TaxID=2714858 RepID=A0A6M1SRG6_9HYPH|nr:hypothetical protein [Devosia aurantiaca]NGP17992.1 hypothetical protein [Devosia aurantiaca]